MNLWADFENEQPLAESAGRGRKQKVTQGRRLTERALLSSLREWLLRDYVAPYCRSLAGTRIFRRCYWVDGLGAGMLEPVAKLSEELAKEDRPIALRGILLEAGSSKRKGGRAAEAEHGKKGSGVSLPKESGSVGASWLEIARDVLEFIDQSPAIFLLNPFGQTLFTYDDLAPLYTRTAPTEVCLLISHKQVETRVIPSLRDYASGTTFALDKVQVKDEEANPPTSPAGDHKGPPHPTQPPSPLRTEGERSDNGAVTGISQGAAELTSLLRSDRWKGLVSKGEGVEQIVGGIIDLLIASMKGHFLAVLPIELPIQMGPAVVERAPYTLIFATRRQDSLVCMNDAMCLHRRRLYEESLRGVLTEDWFVRQRREHLDEELRQLYGRTLEKGRGQRARRWPDLRQQLMLAHFGQFTLDDYDEVIYKLLLNGEVRCEWRQRPAFEGDAEKRAPGNEDALIWK